MPDHERVTSVVQDNWNELAAFLHNELRAMTLRKATVGISPDELAGLCQLGLIVQNFELNCQTFDARVNGIAQRVQAYSDGYNQ